MSDYPFLPFVHERYLQKYECPAEHLLTPFHWYMVYSGFRVEGMNNTPSQFFEYRKNEQMKIQINYTKNNLKLACLCYAVGNQMLIDNEYFTGRRFAMNASAFLHNKEEFKCLEKLFHTLQIQLQAICSSNPQIQPLQIHGDEEQPLQLGPIREENAQHHLIQTGPIREGNVRQHLIQTGPTQAPARAQQCSHETDSVS
ncbi:unnamed protein product [Rotaria magnacalcarata]|uniref:Uncharacterized protein n=2 Tax=Rotaria magnacalcarata TaxID=392030 RepID=A0A820DXL8_9BILA|nr:unnamed protein product [Rotaria magnacalcarata]